MAVKVCRHCDKIIETRPPYGQTKTMYSCCKNPVCKMKDYHRRNITRLDLAIVVRRNNTWVRLASPNV